MKATATTGLVLVVDDSESNRYVLAVWLRRAGYDVIEAATGAEALAAIHAQSCDLAVLDVNLPDMTGYAVCEAIKSLPGEVSIPVLHVSATAVQPSDRSEGLRRGAEGYLVEPLEREELLATVEALLRGANAQRTALHLAGQLSKLNDATLAVNQAATLEELLTTIVREAAALFDAPATLRIAIEERVFNASCAPGAAPLVVTSEPSTAPAPVVAALEVPLEDRGRQIGTLRISGLPRALHGKVADETAVVLSQYARAAGTAIRNMRSYNMEHGIALMLQRSLLQAVIPHIPALEVAVRYEASAEFAEVGGDFYEIFALGEGHVVVAVGDVAGHSLEAATVMAQLRTGIRAYMLEGHGPTQTLQYLNALMLKFNPELTATICCILYDTRDGSCTYANAGHIPPLLAPVAAPAFYLPNGGPLLGIAIEPATAQHLALAPGDALILFTDGLVERRLEHLETGFARVRAAADQQSGSLEALCDRILREAGPASIVDDIAIVAIRRKAAI